MHIDFAPELEALRLEIAAFPDSAPTPAIREAGQNHQRLRYVREVMEWHRILQRRGWAALAWPPEIGGTGRSVEQRLIVADEYCARDLPPLLPNSLQMVGPLLIALSTTEQQDRYLLRIHAADDYWTQGYSEPNSGSDLASLSCSADPDGHEYVVNGSRIWTTLAHRSNPMLMLVRTSKEGDEAAGITFLLLDRTDHPGMTIRPIIGLDGLPEQCEVFFHDVRVPQSGRVGEVDDGWTVAKALLKHERSGSQGPFVHRRLQPIREASTTAEAPSGGVLANDPVFQRDLGELEADVASYEYFEKLAISGHSVGDDPVFPSVKKAMGQSCRSGFR